VGEIKGKSRQEAKFSQGKVEEKLKARGLKKEKWF